MVLRPTTTKLALMMSVAGLGLALGEAAQARSEPAAPGRLLAGLTVAGRHDDREPPPIDDNDADDADDMKAADRSGPALDVVLDDVDEAAIATVAAVPTPTAPRVVSVTAADHAAMALAELLMNRPFASPDTDLALQAASPASDVEVTHTSEVDLPLDVESGAGASIELAMSRPIEPDFPLAFADRGPGDRLADDGNEARGHLDASTATPPAFLPSVDVELDVGAATTIDIDLDPPPAVVAGHVDIDVGAAASSPSATSAEIDLDLSALPHVGRLVDRAPMKTVRATAQLPGLDVERPATLTAEERTALKSRRATAQLPRLGDAVTTPLALVESSATKGAREVARLPRLGPLAATARPVDAASLAKTPRLDARLAGLDASRPERTKERDAAPVKTARATLQPAQTPQAAQTPQSAQTLQAARPPRIIVATREADRALHSLEALLDNASAGRVGTAATNDIFVTSEAEKARLESMPMPMPMPKAAAPRAPESIAASTPVQIRERLPEPEVRFVDADEATGDRGAPRRVQGALGELVAVADTHLDRVRGGFDTPTGLQISFGIDRAVYVNGNLVTTTSLNFASGRGAIGTMPVAGASLGTISSGANGALTIVQNGAGNTVFNGATAPATAGTIVQNTLNDQRIQSITSINATVNSLQVLKAQALQSTLQGALIDSLRR